MKITELCKHLDEGTITVKDLLHLIQDSKIEFFWHPLGFVLGTYLENDEEKIRIHIWPKSGAKKQSPYWNIHNHIFHLKSWVLKGEITNQEYETVNDDSSNYCIYHVDYLGEQSHLIKTNIHVSLIESKKNINKEGSKYSMRSNVFHCSEKTSDCTALTVVLSTKTKTKNPMVIGRTDGQQQYIYSRAKVELPYITSLMNELLT